MKLYEALSKTYGANFVLKIENQGNIIAEKELTLDRINANVLSELEEEHNISMENFEDAMRSKMATNATLVGWKLLREKDEFDNNIKLFRMSLSADGIVDLMGAIMKAFENSVPVVKNVEGPVIQK